MSAELPPASTAANSSPPSWPGCGRICPPSLPGFGTAPTRCCSRSTTATSASTTRSGPTGRGGGWRSGCISRMVRPAPWPTSRFSMRGSSRSSTPGTGDRTGAVDGVVGSPVRICAVGAIGSRLRRDRLRSPGDPDRDAATDGRGGGDPACAARRPARRPRPLAATCQAMRRGARRSAWEGLRGRVVRDSGDRAYRFMLVRPLL